MFLMAIIMVSPIAALLLFRYFPLKVSLPVYTVILIISGYCYHVMFKSMRDEAKTGMETMFGKEGLVIEDINPEGKIVFKNDIWTATTRGDKLVRGDRVKILSVRGLVLTVEGLRKDETGKNTGRLRIST